MERKVEIRGKKIESYGRGKESRKMKPKKTCGKTIGKECRKQEKRKIKWVNGKPSINQPKQNLMFFACRETKGRKCKNI